MRYHMKYYDGNVRSVSLPLTLQQAHTCSCTLSVTIRATLSIMFFSPSITFLISLFSSLALDHSFFPSIFHSLLSLSFSLLPSSSPSLSPSPSSPTFPYSSPLFLSPSSYHLSYNMVLNMLRVEDADPENLLKSSFYQYQVRPDPFPSFPFPSLPTPS